LVIGDLFRMFSKEAIKAMHASAHESLDVLFAHCAQLPAGDFVRPLAGFGQASVRDQLVHIAFVEEACRREARRSSSST
jgi:uncharacterized damage-inducible protein DinB